MAKKDKEPVRLMTPTGRLVNNSLFEKDIYKDEKGREADPSYKMEMVFDIDEEFEAFEAEIVAAAVDEWGAGAEDDYWEGKMQTPISDGDVKAAEREEKGKNGDAYKGKLVVRAHTIFNRNGEDAPGGVYVCNAQAEELDFAERGAVYNGCHGKASVQVSTYDIKGRGVTLYLNGFQFVEDGERLRGADPSTLFSPMMGKGSQSKGRRSR